MTKKDFVEFAELIQTMKTRYRKYPRFDLLVERVTPQDVILLFENEIVKIFKRHSQTFKEEKFRKACNQ